MNPKSKIKGLALRTFIVLVAMGLIAGVVMVSLPDPVLAGGGNSNVATGSLIALT